MFLPGEIYSISIFASFLYAAFLLSLPKWVLEVLFSSCFLGAWAMQNCIVYFPL